MIYKKACEILLDAIKDSIKEISQNPCPEDARLIARSLLIKAQQDAEELFCDSEEYEDPHAEELSCGSEEYEDPHAEELLCIAEEYEEPLNDNVIYLIAPDQANDDTNDQPSDDTNL